jgi:hypothetical protein
MSETTEVQKACSIGDGLFETANSVDKLRAKLENSITQAQALEAVTSILNSLYRRAVKDHAQAVVIALELAGEYRDISPRKLKQMLAKATKP